MKRAIVIMAKVPLPGAVKTRLEPMIPAESCAALAKAFLADTTEKARRICENVIIAFSPASEQSALSKIVGNDIATFAQVGNDLGERVVSSFEHALATGAESVVMIGTDSPTFPADYIEQTFEFLELETDVVLGKTTDGGFYLIGLRTAVPSIFGGVRWSSQRTFDDVFRNASDLGLHLREVPSWYDVDEPRDLEKLRVELTNNANARRRAPQTFKVLFEWGGSE